MKILTRSSVKWATTIGVKKPVVVPTKLIAPYKDPAKFGAKSWEFWRFVKVDAPLKPSEVVMIATHQYGWWPTYAKPIKQSPGIMCAIQKKTTSFISNNFSILSVFSLQNYLQKKQNDFRMAVTDITFDFRSASPIAPKMKPEKRRARYGRLAKMPAWARLKPSTSLMNFGAAVIKKYNPHRFP